MEKKLIHVKFLSVKLCNLCECFPTFKRTKDEETFCDLNLKYKFIQIFISPFLFLHFLSCVPEVVSSKPSEHFVKTWAFWSVFFPEFSVIDSWILHRFHILTVQIDVISPHPSSFKNICWNLFIHSFIHSFVHSSSFKTPSIHHRLGTFLMHGRGFSSDRLGTSTASMEFCFCICCSPR